ncbi:hypothetical protein [Nonomuraea sediminis]|uniref:hypothetical protein n=1 Tax=Nonomuraea sediminis TaxID=2835864 RepID=UPI001BDBF2EF|nr:hypothetical protein [Nonomuraea sediminis]
MGVILVAYAVIHVYWAVAGGPHFAIFGESFVPGVWTPVVLSGLALGAWLLVARRPGRAAVALGWGAGVGMLLYSFMFALDLAGMLFGEPTDWPGFLIRSLGVTGGLLLVLRTAATRRTLVGACPDCGRVHGRSPERRTDAVPRWAFAAAYLALAGSLARMGAELVMGLPWSPSDPSSLPFLIAYGLAGVVLPPALVHRWGRIWPSWVVPLAGRDVPRWLVAGPAMLVGFGLSGYFGLAGMTHVVMGDLDPARPLWWTLAVVPGYTVWGLGLVVAAVPYLSITRRPCRLQRGLNESSTVSLAG